MIKSIRCIGSILSPAWTVFALQSGVLKQYTLPLSIITEIWDKSGVSNLCNGGPVAIFFSKWWPKVHKGV